MGNEIATVEKPAERPISTVKRSTEMLNAFKHLVTAALPGHMNADSFLNDCKVAIARNPDLLKCHELSVMNAARQAATLGLRIDGVLGHGYLVPYKDECTFIAGYRGLVELCRRSGQVRLFEAHIVRADDEFDFMFGTNPFLKHRPSAKQSAMDKWTWVYAICMMHDGKSQFEVMSYDEVMHHKNRYAKGTDRSSSPWKTAEMEMAKKTVTRRLVKYLPVSPDIVQMAMADEYEEAGVLHEVTGRVPNATVRDLDFGEPSNQGESDRESNQNQTSSSSSQNKDEKAIEDEIQGMFVEASLKGQQAIETLYNNLCGPDAPYVITERLAKWIVSCREIAKRRAGKGGDTKQKEFA